MWQGRRNSRKHHIEGVTLTDGERGKNNQRAENANPIYEGNLML